MTDIKKIAVNKRLTFDPYNENEMRETKLPSLIAFNLLKAALTQSKAKPDAPEKSGSWERTAQLHMFFDNGEIIKESEVAINTRTGAPIKNKSFILNPEGYTAILPTETVALLQSLWDDYVKEHGTRADALRIYITNEWLKTGITDADDEPAISSGLVKP